MRKLVNGHKVKELKKPIDLVVHTKCPGKWLLVDLETGEEYLGSAEPNLYGMWKRIKERTKK